MTRETYIQQVDAVLGEHTARATQRLGAVLTAAPPSTQGIEIAVFVDQDGEGCLNVRAALVGPDLAVLNRAIDEHAELFATRMTPAGFDPALPLMEPRAEPFSVHDTLTDCATAWLQNVWRQTEQIQSHLPVVVLSPEGYGSRRPFDLRHPA